MLWQVAGGIILAYIIIRHWEEVTELITTIFVGTIIIILALIVISLFPLFFFFFFRFFGYTTEDSLQFVILISVIIALAYIVQLIKDKLFERKLRKIKEGTYKGLKDIAFFRRLRKLRNIIYRNVFPLLLALSILIMLPIILFALFGE